MNSTFQDTVLDFDLNFLQQSSSNAGSENRLDRQKKAILIAKKKTIATDLLIRKYYDKKEKLEQTEVTLLASKEECKQVCIDYKNSVEKCTQLEKSIQLLQSQYTALEQNYIMSQNQVEAMKSHARQLQVLIKENETAAEAMKIDSRLEKKHVKDFEKKILSLQNEQEEILNHLCLARDIAFGKIKLKQHHRSILQKYESKSSLKDQECSMSEDSSDETDFFDDSPTSPLYTVIEICPEVEEKKEVDEPIDDNKARVKQDSVRVIEDHESDYSNGVVSEDTGRGSSLAFSDVEKCVNSPDYFTADSPPAECTKNRKNLIDASTSPRRNHEGIHIATSPIIFDDEALLDDNTSPHSSVKTNEVEYLITDLPISDEIVTLKEKRQLIDCGTSPIRDIEKANIATSPIPFIPISEIAQCTSENLHNLSIIGNDNINADNGVINSVDNDASNDIRNHIVFEDLSSNCELEIIGKSKEEKQCLENINSFNLHNENSNDLEVEMILNSMRITQKLITPLPPTPVKLSKKNKHIQMHLDPVPEQMEITERHTTCPDAIKLREENKGLQTSIADLTKEILNIKNILKKQLLMPESPKKTAAMSNNDSVKLINDASQETITIVCDHTESIANENDEVQKCETLEASENEIAPVIYVKETLLNNNDEDCTEAPLRSEVMNHERNNSIEHSPHTSPEPLLSHTLTEIHNNTQCNNICEMKCREKLSYFEDDLDNCVEDSSVPNCRIDPVESMSLSKSTNGHIGRRKKLSRLDKFKRKLAPQSKIKFKVPPIRKKRTKSKIIPVTKIHPPDTVNSKIAYEKAIKVMRELKLKKNISKKDHFISSNGKRVEFNSIEVTKPKIKNSESQDDLIESSCKEIKENKKYVVSLSRLNLDKHMQNIKESDERQIDRHKCFSPERTNRERIDPNKRFSPESTNRVCIDRDKCFSPEGTNREPIGRNKCFSPERTNRERIDRNKYFSPESTNREQIDRNKCFSPESTNREPIGRNKCFSPERTNRERIDRNKCFSPERINREGIDRNKCYSPEHTNRERTSSDNIDSNPTKNIITTRSRSKRSEPGSPAQNNTYNGSSKHSTLEETDEIIKKYDRSERVRKRLKRVASDSSDINCKRVLRSSNVRDMCRSNEQVSEKISPRSSENFDDITTDVQEKSVNEDKNNSRINLHAINTDHTIFDIPKDINDISEDSQVIDPRQSIICKMIEKYGRGSVKFTPKKIPENITNAIYKKLGDDIGKINKLPGDESKSEINKLVKEIQGMNRKNFMAGFMKYLKDPLRKEELYNKVVSAPAPSMTKSEQVLLYIIKELELSTPDTVNTILSHIEFALFHLNKTPEFDVIESLSHFYALTCRYFRLKTRLRMFLLDAMYCLQFKVIPLIKQCLDVWMHILPLAHMGIAKSPLVTCLVYLLHFYKCEDRFNRIQDIRFILNKKYFYKMTDWNEPKILEMFKNSVTELREIPLEKKMLRLAFIILAKRHGPKWCQKNIINNILTPVIENEDVSLNIKKFCVSLLGPLLKPYPKDMKVHCEIAVNQLLDMLDLSPPDDMKEAIFTSLIYMNKHNQTRVTQALLSWSPKKPSDEFELLMCDFVREKPVRVWKSLLSKIML